MLLVACPGIFGLLCSLQDSSKALRDFSRTPTLPALRALPQHSAGRFPKSSGDLTRTPSAFSRDAFFPEEQNHGGTHVSHFFSMIVFHVRQVLRCFFVCSSGFVAPPTHSGVWFCSSGVIQGILNLQEYVWALFCAFCSVFWGLRCVFFRRTRTLPGKFPERLFFQAYSDLSFRVSCDSLDDDFSFFAPFPKC